MAFTGDWGLNDSMWWKITVVLRSIFRQMTATWAKSNYSNWHRITSLTNSPPYLPGFDSGRLLSVLWRKSPRYRQANPANHRSLSNDLITLSHRYPKNIPRSPHYICMVCNVLYCNVMYCTVMQHYVMSCHDMSCYVMLCYAMLLGPGVNS